MPTPKIILKPGRDSRVKAGHLWVFSNEIGQMEGSPGSGEIVDVYSSGKTFLGRGFHNKRSLIAVRILTTRDEPVGTEFFAGRIAQAGQHRESLYPGENSYRLVFGESDLLPGLVIDRFDGCFVIQSYCLGMDLLLPHVVQALKDRFPVRCLIKKNDSAIRILEGLKEEVEVLEGPIEPPIVIGQGLDGGQIRFKVDPLGGQKSGFFFDQRENRERLTNYCRDRTVLDCFSYTGAFGLYAARAGARSVTCVESSAEACGLMEKNFRENSHECGIVRGDVYQALERFRQEKRKFDIIVLDPPAMAKSKKNLFAALRKYRKLNELALSVLNERGILFSSSCSHHVGREDFLDVLRAAGAAERRQVQVLEMRGQSRDHPVLLSMPETDYLKCAILRVV